MHRAIDAVLNEGMSIRRAAQQYYDVPKSSLGYHLSGRMLEGASCGPAPFLSVVEEEELVVFLTRCCTIGYGKSCKEVLALVQDILES